MESMEGVLAVFGIFIAPLLLVGFIVYYKGKNAHAERVKMIEAGMRPDPKGADIVAKKKYKSIESGVFFISVAIGLLVGYALDSSTTIDSVLAYFISIPLFVGIGNLALYFMISKKEEEEKAVEEKSASYQKIDQD